MNRQRKVVITVTYNDLGVIVDTKAEELDSSAQPNLQPTCNQLATDTVSRTAVIDTEGLDEEVRCAMCRNQMKTDRGCDGNCKYDEKLYEKIMQILNERIKPLPSAQPEPCGDAVSRQYILDVLDEYIEEYGEVDKEGNHDLKWCAMGEAKMVVKEAPSVQPEIIHCQDCIHAIEDALCGGYWCKGKAVTSDHYCGYAERRTDEAD